MLDGERHLEHRAIVLAVELDRNLRVRQHFSAHDGLRKFFPRMMASENSDFVRFQS
jgi:hypothetical protein